MGIENLMMGGDNNSIIDKIMENVFHRELWGCKMNLSQWDLANFLKKKNKFMSAREIAKETHSTLTSVNRKLNALYPRTIKKRVRKIKVGKCYCKRPVSYFKSK